MIGQRSGDQVERLVHAVLGVHQHGEFLRDVRKRRIVETLEDRQLPRLAPHQFEFAVFQIAIRAGDQQHGINQCLMWRDPGGGGGGSFLAHVP